MLLFCLAGQVFLHRLFNVSELLVVQQVLEDIFTVWGIAILCVFVALCSPGGILGTGDYSYGYLSRGWHPKGERTGCDCLPVCCGP